MSEKKTKFFYMELQTVSGEKEQAMCFKKQCYNLFYKVNESQTEGLIIKESHIKNDDILITDYTKVYQLPHSA